VRVYSAATRSQQEARCTSATAPATLVMARPAARADVLVGKGRYGDETVRSPAAVVCGESALKGSRRAAAPGSSPSCSSARSAAGSLGSRSSPTEMTGEPRPRRCARALRRRRTRWSCAAGARRLDEVDPTRDALRKQCRQLPLVAEGVAQRNSGVHRSQSHLEAILTDVIYGGLGAFEGQAGLI
jgi:hypothetical protein